MKGVSGREIRTAFVKGTVWNTPVAAGAGSGVLCLPNTVKRESSPEMDDSLGMAAYANADPGSIKCEGDQPLYLRYDGVDLLLAMFMGIAGAPVRQGATAAYAYKYGFAPDLDGLFVVRVRNVKGYIEEISSAKITGMTIKGDVGKPLQVTFKLIGTDKVYDSEINTLETFNNVTILETANRVLMNQGVFRINNQAGLALADGNRIFPSSFELSAQRKQTGYVTGEFVSEGAAKQDIVDEPTNDGAPEISLKLTFPRHKSQTNLLDLGNDVRKKLDVTFTGATIEGAYKRSFGMQFPHLLMTNVDPADAQGNIQEPLEFKVMAAVAAPAGMDFTEPFRITGVNKRATDPLN